ncbi:hypothetical protein M9978_17125 [Sphingomonas sp. MG17]|uniref:Uncharacterized protein n=1 Tax=Sphingomonas tagetis TaxID=2949092 RepID=A0A9X2KMW9_9SPHN|nr:hypothetical protein [Sphingomonas tagetis]MCP3732147.1 hypothetical protein [Sphingomonas tagetis]
MAYKAGMDAPTVQAGAELVRRRAARNGADHGDGMARLGAERALTQLAIDLEISAAEFERRPARQRRPS